MAKPGHADRARRLQDEDLRARTDTKLRPILKSHAMRSAEKVPVANFVLFEYDRRFHHFGTGLSEEEILRMVKTIRDRFRSRTISTTPVFCCSSCPTLSEWRFASSGPDRQLNRASAQTPSWNSKEFALEPAAHGHNGRGSRDFKARRVMPEPVSDSILPEAVCTPSRGGCICNFSGDRHGPLVRQTCRASLATKRCRRRVSGNVFRPAGGKGGTGGNRWERGISHSTAACAGCPVRTHREISWLQISITALTGKNL